MSVFVATKDVEIPGTGTVATIRKLKGRHLFRANVEWRRQALEHGREIADIRRQWLEDMAKLEADKPEAAPAAEVTTEVAAEVAAPEPDDTQAPNEADVCAEYDAATVAVCGVTALTGVTAEELTFEFFDAMDDDRLEFLRREILQFTKPALFMSKAERQAEQKNA